MKKKVLILALAVSSALWAGDYEDGEAAYYVGNYAVALPLFEKAAEQDDAAAQNKLGYMYQEGVGVKQNYAEAIRWYTKAAEGGIPDAQKRLGFMYKHGEGVKQNYAEAARWYTKAAEQGDASAQVDLDEIARLAKKLKKPTRSK
jgi:TPR repeat protein